MEVDVNLLPFEEYQDLCMCLFYNEFILLASFLPDHKFLLEGNILQDLLWASRCWLWIDHSNSDLALRHDPASTTFYFWMFTFPIISVADILLHSIPKKEEDISCHLLFLSAKNLLPHSCYLSLNGLQKPFWALTVWVSELWLLRRWEVAKNKK